MGQIEAVIIKQDGTIISGHRRWQALKKLGVNNVRCEIRTFDDELEEQETLVECNSQRKKTYGQIFKEATLLKEIEKKRAKIRMDEAGKHGSEGGRGNVKEEKTPVPNLEQGFNAGRTLNVIAQKVGVPKMKLDTILEVGKLAETGKTKAERDAEEETAECSDNIARS